MTRRSGVTLLEVLVAIFVMGIGMLALLTLFPLGVLRMQKAIQDERCAQMAASARSVWTMKSVYNDPNLTNPFTNPLNPKVLGISDSGPDSPSYPVFVDPTGARTSNGTPFQTLVGGGSLIGRTSVSFVATQQDAYRWFTLLDDIDFEGAVGGGFSQPGTPRWLLPVPPGPMSFTRDIRYSYAFMCQRPRQADTTVVDVTVVVYNKRPLSGVGNLSLPEYAYNQAATFNPGNNTITINYSGAGLPPPPVRVGDWILDASPVTGAGGNIVSAHAYFYRIVAATDSGTSLEIEVETPIRGFTATTPGMTAIVLDGVAEVFTIGTARLP